MKTKTNPKEGVVSRLYFDQILELMVDRELEFRKQNKKVQELQRLLQAAQQRPKQKKRKPSEDLYQG